MTALQVSAQKQLRQLIEQIERLEEEKKRSYGANATTGSAAGGVNILQLGGV